MDAESLVPIVAIVVSGLVGLAGVLLNFVKRSDAETLERASRRTIALQMLSDEELALREVREEVRSFEMLVRSNRERLRGEYNRLEAAAAKTTEESMELLRELREKRGRVTAKIQMMSISEIEEVISTAYHGKMLAEVQLYRTLRSKADTLSVFLPTTLDRATTPNRSLKTEP